ncbi:MAG: hypothetical protein M1831_003453 [Alyxoria varia]|nr:MAG: hypothetical protein M1831_003453 [Alyxoria varia]
MYRFPDSPSPPSTPDTHARRQASREANLFGASSNGSPESPNIFAASNQPSTTPAGPPPKSVNFGSSTAGQAFPSQPSTTPAGPPPSSVFGSANAGAGIPFPLDPARGTVKDPSKPSDQHARGSPLRQATRVPTRPNPQDDDFDMMEEDRQDYADDDEDDDIFLQQIQRPHQDSHNEGGFDVRSLAKSFAAPAADLAEPEDLIVGTEEILNHVAHPSQDEDPDPRQRLPFSVEELTYLWQASFHAIPRFGIGPGEGTDSTSMAIYLATLLLPIHHPPPKTTGGFRRSHTSNVKPIPEVILHWLQRNHDPYRAEAEDVATTEPNCAAHESYWGVVMSLMIRGNLVEARRLLVEADFAEAYTAIEDGNNAPGYSGRQLDNVQRVVNRALQTLESCPALQHKDWNVKGADWTIFRKRVDQAQQDLKSFAEGSNTDLLDEHDEPFEAKSFGLSRSKKDSFSMSQRTRRVQSKVPWTLYEDLNQFYGVLLGREIDLISTASDWLEAVLALTVWWNGDDLVGNKRQSLSASRQFGRSSTGKRLADSVPTLAYQQRLRWSFRRIASRSTDQETKDLGFNQNSALEVGLGCIFEGDTVGLLGILRGWSLLITAAVAEIADRGGWLAGFQSPSRELIKDLDDSDLMLLSYGPTETSSNLNRDKILVQYADKLAGLFEIELGERREKQKGWMLSAQVISRLRDEDEAARRISSILDQIEFTDTGQVDETIDFCHSIGLSADGRRICQRFANHLMSSTSNYGEAITYYLRGSNLQKVKEVFDLLVSLSLVHSLAYPPRPDPTLQTLISSPVQTLSRTSTLLDLRAREHLVKMASGYAALRKFYELRDVDPAKLPKDKRKTRRVDAAKILVALVQSAGDPIHGGLYDEEVRSAVQVDGLLVLLGETLPFVLDSPSNSTTTTSLPPSLTFTLLKSVEDLATIPVNSRIRQGAESCLKAALANAHDPSSTSTSDLLKKSMMMSRSGESSSGFSMIGSEMLGSGSDDLVMGDADAEEDEIGASGVLVKRPTEGGTSRRRQQEKPSGENAASLAASAIKEGDVKRGWDWRSAMDSEASGEDVIRMVRYGLAQGVASGWLS